MRRSFLFALITSITISAFLLVSCTDDFDDWHYTIENKTAKDITFTFNDETVTLPSAQSKAVTLNSGEGRKIPRSLKFSGHPESVRMETRGLVYVFMPIEPVKLIVENKVNLPITIKAGNFLASPSVNDEVSELKIDAEGKLETGIYIYTLQPRFSVEPYSLPGSNIPIIDMWKISEEADGTTVMNLTFFASRYGYEG